MAGSQARISPVLHEKLGENGAAALAETIEAFMQQHARELEDAAWRRVEMRFDRVDDALERLADAQARTEATVEKLSRGQDALRRGHGALRREVGALSENVGFGLEGIARTVLPGYLERHLDLHVLGPLGEELNPRMLGPEGREQEFDLYGIGMREGRETIIVGEVKSRIYSDDVRRFVERIAAVRSELPDNTLPVLFGYNVHPAARQEAEKADLLLVAAYER